VTDENTLHSDDRFHDQPEPNPAEDQPGQGTVGKLVERPGILQEMPSSRCQKLDKAADSLEDQGPLSVLGIMANNLF